MKNNNFFQKSVAYLKDSKRFVYLALAIFLVSAAVGYFASDSLGEIFDPIIGELFSLTEGLTGLQLTVFIFFNNLKSAFFALFMGILFGLPSIANAVINGALVGYVVSIVSDKVGFFSIWRLLPHGIFELPAIFISIGLGMRMGFAFVSNYFRFYKKDRKMKAWAFAAVVFAFAGFLLLSASFQEISDASTTNVLVFLADFLMLALSLVAIGIFLFSSKKLRSIQFRDFRTNLDGSARVFLGIVVPLLVIAAIIEGILISVL